MRSTGHNPSHKELKEMIKSVDADENGTLNFREFKTLMIREVNKGEMAKIRREFNAADKNNDGYVSVREARIALRNSGMKHEDIEESLKEFFKSTDFDNDNRVTYEG